MLLAMLVLISSLALGFSITQKLFRGEQFGPGVLFGIIGYAYLLYIASMVFGFGEGSIIASIIAAFACAFIIYDWKKSAIKISHLFSRDSLAVFLFVFLLMGYAATRSFDFSDGLSLVSQDWAVHLGITNTISQGNFPPDYPYLSDYKLSYYYFGHLFIASLVKGGADLFFAYSFSIILLISAFVSAFYVVGRDFSKSKLGGLLGIFLAFFSSACAACLINDAAWLSPFFPFSANSGFPLRPLVLSYAFSQLPMAYSYLFLSVFLRAMLEFEKSKKLLAAGALVALLPLFGPYFFALAFMLFFYVVLFDRRREALKGLALAAAIGGIQYLLFFNEKASASALSFIKLNIYANNPGILELVLFWLQNAGGHILLALLAVYFLKIRGEMLGLFVSAALLFVVASVVTIFPDPWANEKLFTPLFIICGLLAGALLAKAIEMRGLAKFCALLVLILALLSTAHQFKLLIDPSMKITLQQVGTSAEVDACRWAAANTPANSAFLAPPALEESGGIYIVGGRKTFYSNPYWVRSQGFNEDAIRQMQAQMLNGDVQMLKEKSISHIFANAEIEKSISPGLRGSLSKVYSENGVSIYSVDS